MKLLITGGTGFIGTPLTRALIEKNHTVTVITRAPKAGAASPKNLQWATWSEEGGAAWKRALKECDGVINLAGESIAAKRWTPEQKKKIRDSRVETTRALVMGMLEVNARPKVLINASAVGYYGPCGDEIVTENTKPGQGFLADVCKAWENEAREAETFVERTLRLRIGVVLGKGGGALAKMVPPFKMYVGGPLGSGRQWMPWIHIADIIGLTLFLLEHPSVIGPINATAPNPKTMAEFCKTLGLALKRPSWAPVPAPVLRLMLGEMADMLLTGQRAIPEAAQKLGYRFRFPNLDTALSDGLS